MEFEKDKIKGIFQHGLNELHLYCRLRKLGIPRFMAKGIAKIISPKKLLYEYENGKPACQQGEEGYNGSKPNSKQTSQNSKNLLS